MAGSKNRLGRFLKSSVDAFLTPAENPRENLADPEQQQKVLLEHVRTAALKLGATRQRLEAQRSGADELVATLDAEARKALQIGRDDLARLALQRQRSGLADIDQLNQQIAGLRQEEQHLGLVGQRIGARIEAARAREQLAAARHSAAQAQVAVGEVLSGIGAFPGEINLAERIERDAEDLEARATAIEELIATGVLGRGLLGGANADAAPDDEIERRLEALRNEMAGQPS